MHRSVRLYGEGGMCCGSAVQGLTICDRLILYVCNEIPYSGYFSGGKIFVRSEFLASSWKKFRGCGILNHTPVHCGTVSWVKISLNHENHKNFTPRKIPAIRYLVAECVLVRAH